MMRPSLVITIRHLLFLWLTLHVVTAADNETNKSKSKTNKNAVLVDTISAGTGPLVTRDYRYMAHVTLYLQQPDGSKKPSGWSTRIADGNHSDKPYIFQPGYGTIEGWTEGVLKMREGERAWMHVPASKGYGDRDIGGKNMGFHIPANSDLVFDMEILKKVPGQEEKKKEDDSEDEEEF